MRKIYLLVVFSFLLKTYKAQQTSPDSNKSLIGNINEMFSAAPTSNNLMKFEEVPVSYYTGIPNVSIPLFNIPTTNKNISLNIQLKYHILNAKPEDRSGESGLGWSLLAGGTITRTVRGGGPDEKTRNLGSSRYRFGIYNKTSNPTYKILNDDYSFNGYDYTFDAGLGRFDTEYDLYQYNFMDNVGRFYIIKNSDSSYSVEKLDKNNLKITCGVDNLSGEINSFTIIDDKGIRYIFDAMEKTEKDTTNAKTGIITGTGQLTGSTELGDFFTSFHLVDINDQNNTNFVKFHYDLLSWVRYQDNNITTRIASDVNYINDGGYSPNNSPDADLPGSFENELVTTISQTHLLTSIDVNGKGSVIFNYELGREDSNYLVPENLYKLTSVKTNFLGQNSSLYVDEYIFSYGYSTTNLEKFDGSTQVLKKMLLQNVTKVSPSDQSSNYVIDYNTTNSILKKDDWMFYTAQSNLRVENYIATDVIKSITYPTKGKVIFDFGENEYSYLPTGNSVMTPVIGTSTVNNVNSSINFLQFQPDNKQPFFTLNDAQTINLDLILGNLVYFNWQFKIFKKNADNTFSPAVYEFGLSAQTCNKTEQSACVVISPNADGSVISEFNKSIALDPGVYYAALSGDYGPSNADSTNANFIAHTTETSYSDNKINKGGGLRINAVTYVENPTSNIFSKKFLYDYTNLDDNERSSGALVFPLPVFKLPVYYSYSNKINNPSITYTAKFDLKTDHNILPVEKTQGSDVGYKYVTVKQIDGNNNAKGKTEYKFRSPIDYPNTETIIITLPAIPISNLDYLRGQLISEKKYNSNNDLISESTSDYFSSVFEKNDGLKIVDLFLNNYIPEIYNFVSYQNMLDHGANFTLTSPIRKFEKYGITLPSTKTENSYFYKNGIRNSVSTTTNYIYNDRDYPILVTQNYSNGGSIVSTYEFANEQANLSLISANMIGIPLQTETKKNGKSVGRTQTLYANPANLLPSSVLSYDMKDLNDSTVPNPYATTEVTYNQYDNLGNLQQYTTKAGIPTAIIWGYNQTEPIAKIEGATYAQVSSLATSIIAASNSDIDVSSENTFIGTLDTFRKDPSMIGYQISTYTYDPLIGVTSITPPSGQRQIYKYDSANRLQSVVDVNGNILKENKYNYKP